MSLHPSTFDLQALQDALDAQRQERGLSWAGVARQISDPFDSTPAVAVSTSTIRGVGKRMVAEGDGVLQMLLWLDRTPESFIAGHPWATAEAARLPRVGRDEILRFDARAIHAALEARRSAKGMTWVELAREIGGFDPASLTGLAKGGRLAFPHVMRIFAWLDRPAASFTHGSSW